MVLAIASPSDPMATLEQPTSAQMWRLRWFAQGHIFVVLLFPSSFVFHPSDCAQHAFLEQFSSSSSTMEVLVTLALSVVIGCTW